MAETGSVKVRVDEAAITRRIRDRLAEVWEEGHAKGFSDCSRYLAAVESNRFPRPTDTPNPYRD